MTHEAQAVLNDFVYDYKHNRHLKGSRTFDVDIEYALKRVSPRDREKLKSELKKFIIEFSKWYFIKP